MSDEFNPTVVLDPVSTMQLQLKQYDYAIDGRLG